MPSRSRASAARAVRDATDRVRRNRQGTCFPNDVAVRCISCNRWYTYPHLRTGFVCCGFVGPACLGKPLEAARGRMFPVHCGPRLPRVELVEYVYYYC